MSVERYDTLADRLAAGRPEAPDYHLGATAVRSLFGLGYAGDGEWAVWMAAHGMAKAKPDNEQMSAGRFWEVPVLEWYRVTFHAAVEGGECRVWSDEVDWLRVSPDALVGDHGLVEVKCPRSSRAWGDDCTIHSADSPEAATVPAKHLMQVYTQLAASGREWCDLVAFHGPHRAGVYRVMADPEYQQSIVRRVAAWRQVHLVHGRPPDYDDSADCARYYRMQSFAADDTEEADEHTAGVIFDWLDAKTARDEAQGAYKTQGARLLDTLESKRTAIAGHGKVVITTKGSPRWYAE